MKKVLLLLLTLIAVIPASSQIRGNNISVTVTPDHKDWKYHLGEKATFKVCVLRSGTLVDNAVVDFEAGPEMYPDVEKKNVTLKDGTMTWTGSMKQPGFYRLTVTAHVGGKEYKQACAAAFEPEKLEPSTVMPADFEKFWKDAIDEARKTDLNPTKRLLPERCTKDVNVYEVSFQNILPNYLTYGILCVSIPLCSECQAQESVRIMAIYIQHLKVP